MIVVVLEKNGLHSQLEKHLMDIFYRLITFVSTCTLLDRDLIFDIITDR